MSTPSSAVHLAVQSPVRLSRMRDARVVHEYVETAELLPDALCRAGDRGLIRDVEVEGGASAPTLFTAFS